MLRKVVCALSGGVDSAVAAYLVQFKAKVLGGYDVCGVFMKNWDSTEEMGYCMQDNDLNDAKLVAEKLNMPLIEVDFVKEYWNHVFEKLIDSYKSGTTINPDVLCNKYIKFHHFFQYAQSKLGADAIATGHYAGSSFGPFLEKFDENENCQLLIPADLRKDQTLFLSNIPQKALRKTMFPLGNYLKPEVKHMAQKLGLERIAEKRESTGLCFIGRRDFAKFINQYIPSNPGKIIELVSGELIGEHTGIHQYTIGQNMRIGTFPLPVYVCSIDRGSNTIYACTNTHHPVLYSDEILLESFHSINEQNIFHNKHQFQFRFQSGSPLEFCTVSKENEILRIHFKRPFRAVTIGQSMALYDNQVCLGSGIISHVNKFKFYNKEFAAVCN